MMAEFFRIASHLVWYGTFAQDVGALSPVFYMFTDRERIFRHRRGHLRRPHASRAGSASAASRRICPTAGTGLVRRFPHVFAGAGWTNTTSWSCETASSRRAPQGVGAYTLDEAIEWGVTGPGLRACGFDWDFRKKRPYSGLRAVRVRHSHRPTRRLLRPRGGARGGDAAEPADHRAMRQQHAGRPVQVGPSR